MKKTRLIRQGGTLFTALLLLVVSEVQASRLFLTTNAHKATVELSGVNQYSHDGFFEITQLRPGVHPLRVFKRAGRHARGRAQHIHIFRGRIVIPQQSDVYARITPRGHLVIDRVVPRGRKNTHHRQHQRGYDYSRNGRGQQRDNPRGDVDYNRNHQRNAPRANFSIVLRMVDEASFDREKMIIAKQFLRNNTVTSRQVLDLMTLFNFESSRLEIAKFAYDRTIDPHNYFIVNKGFQFRSSKVALNRYIQ